MAHRLCDRTAIAAFVSDAPTADASATPPIGVAEATPFDLGASLRDRRRELGLTQKEAAAQIGANEWTLMKWELNRHQPDDRFYPSLIRFLGREPWPDPVTTAQRLHAERLRRGLTCARAAAVLQVDEGSIAGGMRRGAAPSGRQGQGGSVPYKERLTVAAARANLRFRSGSAADYASSACAEDKPACSA